VKIAIRYQSRGGNTKEVAEAIAKAAGIAAESIAAPIVEPVDLLLVGGGVYKWDIDPALKAYLENLDPGLVKSAAAFTTSGGMDKTGLIRSIVERRGIKMETETLSIKMGAHNLAWLGGKGSVKLTEKQADSIRDFVNRLIH
jgi:flavodoxin